MQSNNSANHNQNSPKPFLRIGTRGSPLALFQARLVQSLLADAHKIDPSDISINVIKTDGDRTQAENTSLKDIGGKGLFSKEIEAALLAHEIDIGVHSAKDMATNLPNGLVMPVFLEREDVRDAFISLIANQLEDLPLGARVGSSSLRRAAQLRHVRPDLRILEFRGNVDTRLQKLADNVADATLLAAAGLNRLQKTSQISQLLDAEKFPTAPAQGAVGIEYRQTDERTADLLASLNHGPTQTQVLAERALLERLDGSCRTPIGVFTQTQGDQLHMLAEILSPDGTIRHRHTLAGDGAHPLKLGDELGKKLLLTAGPEFIAALQSL